MFSSHKSSHHLVLNNNTNKEDLNLHQFDNKITTYKNTHHLSKDNTISINNPPQSLINAQKLRTYFDEYFYYLDTVGRGAFGVVLKAKHKLDRGIYAVKVIDFSKMSDLRSIKSEVNEARKMMRVKSNFVVQYVTCWIQYSLGELEKVVKFEESESESQSESESDNGGLTSFSQSIPPNPKKSTTKPPKNPKLSSKFAQFSSTFSQDEGEKPTKKEAKFRMNYRDDSVIASFSRNSLVSTTSKEAEAINFSRKFLFLQMEFCEGLSLNQLIGKKAKEKGKIERKRVFKYMEGMLKGLEKMHGLGIIHRDIKPDNIFVIEDEVKIGDFGLSTNKRVINSREELAGSPMYLSPEQKKGGCYNEKVDIFASGLTLYEMCACFETQMEKIEGFNNLRNKRKIEEKVLQSYKTEAEVILWLTEGDFNVRPSAGEVLKSQIFGRWKREIEGEEL